MLNLCIVTGSRAEYGLLKPIISKAFIDEDIQPHLVVTGTHLEEKFGYTIDEIHDDGFQIAHEIKTDLQTDSTHHTLKALASTIEKFSIYFSKNKPDLLLILGDRFEILGVVQSALFHQIPIAHIHGGEITEGAFDNNIRHAITKFSHLHFTSNEEHKRRVIQMGEQPEHVFNVGAPGLENISNMNFFDKKKLENELGINLNEKILLITFHPTTLESNDSGIAAIESLVQALSYFNDFSQIITMPNADPGHKKIMDAWNKYVESNNNVNIFKSLGLKRYLSLMKISSVVIGNSSSGIIEAPFLKVPTVNIGQRQKGRCCATSIIHCEAISINIQEAIKEALSSKMNKITNNSRSLYGDGQTSSKLISILKQDILDGIIQKKFYDIKQ